MSNTSDMPFTFKPGSFFLFGLFLILAIIFVDQYTKWLVLETMLRTTSDAPDFTQWFTTAQPLQYFIDQRESYNSVMLTSFLNFIMVWNQGISFGMLDAGGDNMKLILIAFALFISIFMTMWMALTPRRLAAFACAFVVGGAVANVIDRVRFGAVADFVDFHVGDWHWPTFNVADSAIVIGAFFLILDQLAAPSKR